MAKVHEAFLGPCCVRSSFGAADERLAIWWHRAGVPLPDVRRAVLLCSTRKALATVKNCLPELQECNFPEDYRRHLEAQLLKLEECLGLRAGRKPSRARRDLAQPVAGEGSPAPAGEQNKQSRRCWRYPQLLGGIDLTVHPEKRSVGSLRPT